MNIVEIDFDTIKKVWENDLWPNRVSKIEPYSAMMFMHNGYDTSFADRPSKFFGGYIDDKLVAVNSFHLAETYMARSRGLWVDPEYRGAGFGSIMLKHTNRVAKQLGAHSIWSFPRKTSILTYERAYYVKCSDWLMDGEFGPNCYVISML